MAVETNFSLDAGSLFTALFTVTDETGINPLDLTDYNVYSQMRQSAYSNTAYDFICSVDGDPTLGIIKCMMPASISSNIRPRRYVMDVEIHNTLDVNDIKRVLTGTVIVNPNVTRTNN